MKTTNNIISVGAGSKPARPASGPTRYQGGFRTRPYTILDRHAGLPLRLIAILCLLIFSLPGCVKKDKTPKELPQLSAVHEKFLTMVREDFGYEDVKLRSVGNTLWIYLPFRERIVDIKASKGGKKNAVETSDKMSVKHVQANLSGDRISVEHDIQQYKTYQKDPGYGSNYSDEYSRAQQELMQAISRVYFDYAEEIRLAGDNPDKPKDFPGIPVFIVMVITDVDKGIEIESMFFFKDLQKAMSMIPSITGDEFLKRYVADIRGNPDAVNDKDGAHLNYRDIDIKEFLARQIENRVNFKYTHSAILPTENTREEVLSAVSETLQAYEYFTVTGVTLKDLFMTTTEDLSKDDLMKFIQEHPVIQPKSRIINVKFGM